MKRRLASEYIGRQYSNKTDNGVCIDWAPMSKWNGHWHTFQTDESVQVKWKLPFISSENCRLISHHPWRGGGCQEPFGQYFRDLKRGNHWSLFYLLLQPLSTSDGPFSVSVDNQDACWSPGGEWLSCHVHAESRRLSEESVWLSVCAHMAGRAMKLQ